VTRQLATTILDLSSRGIADSEELDLDDNFFFPIFLLALGLLSFLGNQMKRESPSTSGTLISSGFNLMAS
jgi:hypothetical protein